MDNNTDLMMYRKYLAEDLNRPQWGNGSSYVLKYSPCLADCHKSLCRLSLFQTRSYCTLCLRGSQECPVRTFEVADPTCDLTCSLDVHIRCRETLQQWRDRHTGRIC